MEGESTMNKKKLTLALAVVMAFTAAGCKAQKTESTDNKTETSTEAKAKDPGKIVEISISMYDRGAIPADQGTYADNAVTKYINEQMASRGVKISWVPVPRNEATTKLNAMIAAGTAPDLIWEYSRTYMNQLQQQGVILPIDNIIEKYSKTYKKYYKENEAMLKPFVTLGDGKVYATTSLRKLTEMPVAGIWYRKDYLDKLGLKTPETMEDVIEAARKMKTADLDGNGQNDSIPIAGSSHYQNIVRGTYGLTREQILVNGKFTWDIHTENYKDTLSTLKLLYDEKLVDPEYITDTNYARQKQHWVTGKAGFYFNGYNSPAETKDLLKNNPKAEPMPLAPLKSKYGQDMLTPQNPARIFTMFNASMKEEKIEAAVKYLDWLAEGNWETVAGGKEGVQYNKVDGYKIGIAGAPSWPGGEYALVTMDKYLYGEFGKRDNTEYKKLSELNDASLKMQVSYPMAIILPYDYTSDENATFKSSFSPKKAEIETKVITGGSGYSVEAGIQDIQKESDRLGGKALYEKMNAWYEQNKTSFQNFQQGINKWMADLAKDLK